MKWSSLLRQLEENARAADLQLLAKTVMTRCGNLFVVLSDRGGEDRSERKDPQGK